MSTRRTGRLMAMAFTVTIIALSVTLVSPLDAFGTGEIIEKSAKSGKSRKDVTAFNVQASDNVDVSESSLDADGKLISLQTFRVFVSVSDPTTGEPISDVGEVVIQPAYKPAGMPAF